MFDHVKHLLQLLSCTFTDTSRRLKIYLTKKKKKKRKYSISDKFENNRCIATLVIGKPSLQKD